MTINISEELPARKNAPAVAAKSSAKKGDAKGGTPQENSAKRIRQAVYDIRYRARREDIDLRKAYSEYMSNSNLSAQEKTAVREKLFGKQGGGVSEQYMVTSVDWAEKNFADAYHKVFVEGIKKEEPAIELAYEQELAEEPERKYKVRVFDPKSEKSYVRFATREKISKLRAKGLKVEMTEHGEAYEGERKKGEQTAAAMGGGKKNVNEDAFDPGLVDRKRREQDRPKDKKQQAPTDASKNIDTRPPADFRDKKQGGTNRGSGSMGGNIKQDPIPSTSSMGPGTSGGRNSMGPGTSGGRNSMGPGTSGGPGMSAIKAKPLATLNRGEKGDGFLGPTITIGKKRIGIPNISPIRNEALDPVGQEDGDVNNDGKKDKTDKYLMNRRKAVGKAIAKKKGKSVNEQSYLDQLKASEKAMREEEKAAIRANAEKNMQALDRAGGAIKAIQKLRGQAGVDYENDPNMVQTAPGIYKSKSAIEAGKTLQQRLDALPSNIKRRQVDAAREKRMMAAPIPEEFITDGATGTTSTEGQNAREIDVLPDKVAKKLQQVTVMPQDGTNPQVGKAPLMMSQQMEGEQLTEEEEDRRERYAFMNVARNLVRAKTGAKRPIAMDPEGTYKKAKEDLAKMVNSGNPDKDKEETPCEEKQLSMADTFLSIANAPKEDSEQLDEFLGPQAAKNVETLLNRGRKVFDKLGIPNNRTPRPTVTKDQQQEKIKKNVK